MRKNKFIVFEGIDGSGKSTQAKLLQQQLQDEGYKTYLTFEPTDSPIGSIIRNIFKRRIEAAHETIAGLFVADRLDHLLNNTNGILKKLNEGYTVISDRYYLSSYAYQGAHVDMDWVMQANSKSAALLKADLTIYIDISPEESLQRVHKGRNDIEIFENLENLQKVQAAYEKAISLTEKNENIIRINGATSSNEVASKVWDVVKQFF